MRLAILAATAVAAVVSLCAGGRPVAAQSGARCTVADPTGTPLNVRAAPQGRIVGTLRNGTSVRLVDTAYDEQGRTWGYVVDWNSGYALGWVFRAYISCY